MTDWSQVPWTPFEPRHIPQPGEFGYTPGQVAQVCNSRYQVAVYQDEHPDLGRIVHLSFKTHDRQAYHDWRDMQRIKNELVGPDFDAVEIYPAESKLVDGANQYHLWVFLDAKLPFGFQERIVSDGNWRGSLQRPFPPGERPADCLSADDFEQIYQDRIGGNPCSSSLPAETASHLSDSDSQKATSD